MAALIMLVLAGSRAMAGEINEFTNKTMTLRAFAEIPSYSVDIQNKTNSAHHVQWQPNLRSLTGVDVSIRGLITVGAGWANNDDPGSAQKKGITDYNDYRVGLTTRSFRGEVDYERFHGFYVENTAQLDPSFTGTYIQDSSMVGGNISANGLWILSPDKFSYTAGLAQNARQEATGGSLILGLSASETFFNTDNGLIPAVAKIYFTPEQDTTFMQFYSLTAKIGYGCTFVADKKWFLTIAGALGGGVEYRSYGDGTRTSSTGGTSKLDALLSFGYNGDDFLAAFIATGDMTSYTTQYMTIPATLGDVKLVIGSHF